MTKQQIEAKAEKFFVWPFNKKELVKYSDAILFTQGCVNEAIKTQHVDAPTVTNGVLIDCATCQVADWDCNCPAYQAARRLVGGKKYCTKAPAETSKGDKE